MILSKYYVTDRQLSVIEKITMTNEDNKSIHKSSELRLILKKTK